MRVVTEKFLREMAQVYPQAASALESFIGLADGAQWSNFIELRAVFPHADLVSVASGRNVIVINICGNKYRLVVAVHFNTGMLYTLRFLTHAEYSKDQWKNDL